MRPNYLPAVLVIVALVGVLAGTFIYFSRTLGGSDRPVEKAVAAFVREPPPPTWRDDQVSAPNVQMAIQQTATALRKRLDALGVGYPPSMALLRVFKDEKVLELWAGPTEEGSLALLRTYPLCLEHHDPFQKANQAPDGSSPRGRSAQDGSSRAAPRSKGTDRGGKEDVREKRIPPIPEGFYTVERYFTKDFTYFLALKLDYPNAADRARAPRKRRHRDLFVRGGCAFDASVHVGIEGIMEVYLVAMEAHAAGQKEVPVHIFPTRMTPEAAERLRAAAGRDRKRAALYDQLRAGYALFEASHRPFSVAIDDRGAYHFDGTPAPAATP